MTWRDRRQQGSINGIPFRWQSSTVEVGRRTAIYSIPGSELGAGWIDNGRRAWRQQLTVFVVGPDYDRDRDDLIEVFEGTFQPPYLLVHPLYGRKNVVIDGPVQVTESDQEGGKATFVFTAVEISDQPTPVANVDTAGQLRDAATAAETAIGNAFEATHSVSGENFLRADALDKMDSALSSVRDVTAKVRTVIDTPSRIASALDQLTDELTYLINSPRRMIDALIGLGQSIKADLISIGNAFGSYSRMGRGSSAIGEDIGSIEAALTPTRKQQAKNARATKHATKGLVLVNMAGAAADIEFPTADEAREARDVVIDALDTLIEEQEAAETALETEILDPDPEVFQALRQLQAALHAHLTAQAGTSLELSDYTPAEPLPSVVIAQQLYGDATRYEEIETRNAALIDHPGFIAETIQVLNE